MFFHAQQYGHQRLFAILVEQDTYEAASAVHDLLVKTHPADREKIELTRKLVSEHLDIDKVLDVFIDPDAFTVRRVRPADQLARLAGSGIRTISDLARSAGSRSGARKET